MNFMRFPSWNEFLEKTSNFEKKATEKIEQFKENHPLMDKAIQGVLATPGIIPPPFNEIALNIYNNFEGDSEEKSNAVINYFNYLKNMGEKHYNRISLQIDNILHEIDDLRQVSAKEETVEQIKEVLISTGKLTERKLEELKKQISEIDYNVEIIKNTTSEIEQTVKENSNKLERLQVLIKQQILLLEKAGITSNEIQLETKPEFLEDVKTKIEKNQKEIEKVEFEIEMETKKKPKVNLDYALKQGNYSYYTENYQKAEQLFERAKEIDPKNETVKTNLAKLYYEQTWKNKNINLKKLAEKIEQYLLQNNYKKIVIKNFPDESIIIVNGERQGLLSLMTIKNQLSIVIYGDPNNFKIMMKQGKWSKKDAIALVTSYFTWGITGIIGTVKNIMFFKQFWKYIQENVDALAVGSDTSTN